MQSKTLVFSSKRTRDTIIKAQDNEHVAVRGLADRIPDTMKTKKAEIDVLRLLFTGHSPIGNDPCLTTGMKLIRTEIRDKVRGYGNQDKKNDLFDPELLITEDACILKLLSCQLKCWYCRGDVVILFTEVRQPNQWTLDRLDNDDRHTEENTVIACLDCNLRRRRQSADKYLMGKRIVVKRG